MLPFTIEVVYQLREYLSVMHDFSGYNPRKATHPFPKRPQNLSILAKVLIGAIATQAFFYKVARVGRCEFTFTEHGLTRVSKNGMLQVPWPDVLYVYSLSQAFLVVKSNGAMPIPYRCLSAGRREFLAAFFANHNAPRHQD